MSTRKTWATQFVSPIHRTAHVAQTWVTIAHFDTEPEAYAALVDSKLANPPYRHRVIENEVRTWLDALQPSTPEP